MEKLVIEKEAQETYSKTLTMLLSYRIAKRQFPEPSGKGPKLAKQRAHAKMMIGKHIKATAGRLASETHDVELYEALQRIRLEADPLRAVETMKRCFRDFTAAGYRGPIEFEQ